MPTLAIGLVLVAAVLHAGWNVLLKTSGDTLWTAVRLQAIGTAILLPVGIAAWFWNGMPLVSAEAFWLAIASGVVEAIYFVCLSAAYSRGALSLVYPLARGTGPLVTGARVDRGIAERWPPPRPFKSPRPLSALEAS